MDKEIRDKNNIIIGWLQDYSDCINAINLRKGYVGYYNKHTDMTFDSNGNIYCYGDGSASLIRDAESN